MMYSFINAGIALIILSVIFVPLEKAFPANPNQKNFRPQWWVDFCYLIGQYVFSML
jgi:hypothetical protein